MKKAIPKNRQLENGTEYDDIKPIKKAKRQYVNIKRATLMRMTESDFAEQVIRFILTRENEELGDLTILKIARRLNISQSHLYHIFQNEKKIPPGKFLMIAKMLRAAILLEDSDNLSSIKIVSEKMGFSSSDYFTRIFKEHFGTTPGKYREYTRHRSLLTGKSSNTRENVTQKKNRSNGNEQ